MTINRTHKPLYFSIKHTTLEHQVLIFVFICTSRRDFKGSNLWLVKKIRVKICLLILEIFLDKRVLQFNSFWQSTQKSYFEMEISIIFFTQYLYNMCVPAIIYCIFLCVLLCVAWEICFLIESSFSRLIRGVGKFSTLVKFIRASHYSYKIKIFLQNDFTLSLDVWYRFFLFLFHKSSDVTHNLMNICN